MKIIKAGKVEPKARKTKCRSCGCTFIFDPATEGKYEYDPREQGGFWRLTCPQVGCKKEVIAYE